jgi:hypothetical protein
VTDVALEVEVGVVDPHRPAEVHEHEANTLAVTRHERKHGSEQSDNVVIRGWGPFEHCARCDVHVRRAVLQVEE